MGELCLESGNKKLAILAIKKEKKYEHRVQMLIDAEAWFEAVEETFSNRKHADHDEFVDKIRARGP